MASEIVHCCIDRPRLIVPRPHGFAKPEAAILDSARWKPGDVIRIKFLDGVRPRQHNVIEWAEEWLQYANLKFLWVGYWKPSDVRITFRPGGSWSYLGTDCREKSPHFPTMQLGWGPDRATTIHEFGHVLGLIHEHQQPAAAIPWNKEAVYAYYEGPPNFWAQADVDQQIFAKYSQGITNTAWDKHSAMQYPIPADHVTDPSFAVGLNEGISPTDAAFISSIYPRM